MNKKILIIGGGVIGLMNAYYLSQAGHKVTIIDESDITNNTSFGNAGLLSAFEKDPLSHPGIILSTFKLILQGRSPLTFTPRLDPLLYKWLIKFATSATHQRLKKTLILFERYGKLAVEGYENILKNGVNFEMHQNGLLLVYTEAKSYKAKQKQLENNPYSRELSKKEIKQMLPLTKIDKVQGAFMLKRDSHIDPKTLMEALKSKLIKNGVDIITNQRVTKLEKISGKITAAITEANRYEANTFLLATGADTSLAKELGRELVLTPAKGYSITFNMEKSLQPKTAALFVDIFTALSPRNNSVRITSKLELGSKNREINPKVIEKMVKTLKQYTIDFELKNPKSWAGLRPLTPNDMPLIGRDDQYNNLIYATGLGWLGITMAPAIAHIIENLVSNNLQNKDSEDILLFSGFYQG